MNINLKNIITRIILIISIIPIIIPIWIMITGCLMSSQETLKYLSPIFIKSDFLARWVLLPQYPTIQPLIELLIDTTEFYVMFWNTCVISLSVIIGQLIIATPAAWSFAMGKWKYKDKVFFLYMLLMILPFQVTMVPSFIIMDQLNLIDTLWAVILPNCFSTFPIFIISKFFMAIPYSYIEAASLDGAKPFKIFYSIGIPLCKPGIICALTLGFLDTWSAIEQPMLFLNSKTLWPLSLYLPRITTDRIGISFVASLVSLVPPLLAFLWGEEYLVQGLSNFYCKE